LAGGIPIPSVGESREGGGIGVYTREEVRKWPFKSSSTIKYKGRPRKNTKKGCRPTSGEKNRALSIPQKPQRPKPPSPLRKVCERKRSPFTITVEVQLAIHDRGREEAKVTTRGKTGPKGKGREPAGKIWWGHRTAFSLARVPKGRQVADIRER